MAVKFTEDEAVDPVSTSETNYPLRLNLSPPFTPQKPGQTTGHFTVYTYYSLCEQYFRFNEDKSFLPRSERPFRKRGTPRSTAIRSTHEKRYSLSSKFISYR